MKNLLLILPKDVLFIILDFYLCPVLTLLDWIPFERVRTYLHYNKKFTDFLWSSIIYNQPSLEFLYDYHFEYVSVHPMSLFYLQTYPYDIDWTHLSKNPNAIPFIEKNSGLFNGRAYIDWREILSNATTFSFIFTNRNRIDLSEEDFWYYLACNPRSVPIFEQNPDKIPGYLSTTYHGLPLLEKYPEKIDWSHLSSNPNAMVLLEKKHR